MLGVLWEAPDLFPSLYFLLSHDSGVFILISLSARCPYYLLLQQCVPEATSARLRLFIGCFKVFSSDKHSLSVFFPYSHYLKNNNKKKKKTASMDALTDYYGVYIQGI